MVEAEEECPPMVDAGVEIFPDDFKEYMHVKLCWKKNIFHWAWGGCSSVWVFWSRDEGEDEDEHVLPYDTNFKAKIVSVFQQLLPYLFPSGCLVQFWAYRTMESRSFLTSKNQPFALLSPDEDVAIHIKRLCSYRMFSEEYKVYVDGESEEDLWLHGRVFRHKFPERTRNVEYYSIKEYPLRDHALICQIGSILAFPVFEPSGGQDCVGVLELVSTTRDAALIEPAKCLAKAFENVGMKCFDVSDHGRYEVQVTDESGARAIALKEILHALEVVCKVHDLPLAQTWVPCQVCRASIADDVSYTSCIRMSTIATIKYCEDQYDCRMFQEACRDNHLRKGQGIVGMAFSSPNLVYCEDVTQFSMAEYPLAHYAREYLKYSGCFALCLQSYYTENDAYILEFFLPSSFKTGGDPRTALRKILGTMKKFFESFILASGEELTEELPIEVIDFKNGEKLNYILASQTTRLPPGPEPLQNGEDQIMQLDSSSHQQSMDVIKNGSNVVGVEQSNVHVTCSRKNGTRKTPKAGEQTTGRRLAITKEEILLCSGKKLNDAAKELGVSRSTLKRRIRESHGIEKWHPRAIKKVYGPGPSEPPPCVEQIPQLNSDDVPSDQPLATGAQNRPRDVVIQDENKVTIKAKYEKRNLKFQLSVPPRMDELQQAVAKRLNMEAGTYDIEYVDDEDEEGDMISICCDDDLRYYIRTCASKGATSVVIFLKQKQLIAN